MAEKEILASRPCPVCQGSAYWQFDKGGKLFTMCDGRHPDNAGCGARIYYGAGNTARMKADVARKGNAHGTAKAKPANDNRPEAANDNGGSGTGDGSADDGWSFL
ncbi:MAG: hypothetical protein RLO01_01890 [Thalassobaculaceae bacterium]